MSRIDSAAVLLARRIILGDETLSRVVNEENSLGRRRLVFQGEHWQLQVFAWKDGKATLELRREGAFFYGSHGASVAEAVDKLNDYLEAREQARKAVSA